MTAAATVPDLQAENSKLRRELEALRRSRDDAERRAEEPPELRGHKTWGVTELSRALWDANTVDRVLPQDIAVLICLYGMCVWPGEAAPPEDAKTSPISYDFLAAKVGYRRSGIEKSIGRLRVLGWVETTRDPASGYLVYTLEIGRMLDDLADFGSWSTSDAKSARPPSRRATTKRAERWQGRSPSLPASPTSKPRSSEAARLIRQWRRTWRYTADPTAVINRLLGEGVSVKTIRRAMHSMENLARPRPEYLRDRVERASYRQPEPDPESEQDPDPGNGGDVEHDSDGPEAGRSRNGGSAEGALTSPRVATSPVEPRQGIDVLPPDPVDERPPEAQRERMSARLGAWLASQPEPSSSRPASRRSVRRPGSAESGADCGSEGPPCNVRSPRGSPPHGALSPVSTENRKEKWTAHTEDGNTAAGHVPERVRAKIPRTSTPPEREGEL